MYIWQVRFLLPGSGQLLAAAGAWTLPTVHHWLELTGMNSSLPLVLVPNCSTTFSTKTCGA